MKLLVVDDDAKVAAAVKRGLEHEGFKVDLAVNGDDGWCMATEIDYDLIVLDIMMPGRNGYVLCADLRRADRWTPILMLTAKDGDLDEAEALDIGADDFLRKPFSFPVLISRVHSMLRRQDRRQAVPVTVGSIRLDTTGRRVWSSGVEVDLSPREFDVLEYLIRRPGQAVSKAALLGGIWEYGFEGDPNIIQVYMTRLRRKLDEPFGTDHIRTVRGIGYRIDGDVG